MHKKIREAIRNAYIALLGKSIESLLNEYEVDSVERDVNTTNGIMQGVTMIYTIRVPLEVGGFILVPVFEEDGDVDLGVLLPYEPIKGRIFCVLTLDYEGNPSILK